MYKCLAVWKDCVSLVTEAAGAPDSGVNVYQMLKTIQNTTEQQANKMEIWKYRNDFTCTKQ